MPDPGNTETWLPVVGFEGRYAVSSAGKVRSEITGKVLRPSAWRGFPQVMLCKNSKVFPGRVHRLVAHAFLGPCPSGFEVNHIDGNRGNNQVDNLEYVTPHQNKIHARDVLGAYRGERSGSAKLTAEQVAAIRKLKHSGNRLADIGRRFGVAESTISEVARGVTWGHIPCGL